MPERVKLRKITEYPYLSINYPLAFSEFNIEPKKIKGETTRTNGITVSK